MSQKIIITFLGKYSKETDYSYGDQIYKGQVFAEALHQFCEYDAMLVCVTEEAKAIAWPILEALEDVRIKPIDIPIGRTAEEMWETFKIITERVNESDHVIFDITHGLRSLPFLVFLFAAYLKAAKNVTIAAIYYGAFELGDSKNNIPAPIIDLSEFVSMIDWLTATTRFVKIGDGQPLANSLKDAIPSNEELRNNQQSRVLRDQLKKAAEIIEKVSLSLSITRPIEAMEAATKLEEILQQSAPSFAERAKPFSLLSQKIVEEYGQFALATPTNPVAFVESIQLQLKMINWYIERDKIVQATTLAREWLISVLILKFELSDQMFDNKKGRQSVENALNNATEKLKPHPRLITPDESDKKFNMLPEADELTKVWSQMTQLRNDIAHVGMNRKPETAAKLKQQAVSLYPKLEKIVQTLLSDQDSLNNIAPKFSDSISIQSPPKLSLEDFLQLPETKPASEYIDGEIYQKPMPKGKHSAIQTFLAPAINQISIPPRIARAFTELRCTFGGRSIVPDIAVFSWNRIPLDANGEIENEFKIAPDWTIEILSPEQGSTRVINNILFCLNQGTQLGWLIDPQERIILTFLPGEQPQAWQKQEILPVLNPLTNLQLSAPDIFNWLNLS